MHKRCFVLALVVMILFTGCKNDVAPSSNTEKIPVTVQPVGRMDFNETAYFIGELTRSQEYDIPTGQAGSIQKIFVKTGSKVAKGQPLFVIEHNQLLVDLSTQENLLQNQVTLAELQLTEMQRQYDNTHALFEEGVVSKDSLDQAQLKLNQANVSVFNAKESLRASISKLKTQISDATIKSPVDGVVASNDILLGQEVGNIIAMKIVGTKGFVVKASVPEAIIPKVKIGQRASISFGEGEPFITTGKVTQIDTLPEGQSHLYGVEIQIDASNSNLRSGMYCEIRLETSTHPQSIGILKQSLRKDDAGHFVVLENQGKAMHRAVKTGLVNGEWIEILEGLNVGDSLIVKGQTYLKEGDLVKIEP